MVIHHYGKLSNQVDIKELVEIQAFAQKLGVESYFEFLSGNFRLVGFGTELKHPETVFSHLEILLAILFLFVH